MTTSQSCSDRDLVRSAAAAIKHVGRGGWGRTSCPLCVFRVGTPDRRASLGVNFDSGRWHCFRCAAWGYLGESEAHAPEAQVTRDAGDDEAPYLGPPEDWTPLWTEPGASATVLAEARRYLARRGVATQTVEEAHIGACLRGKVAGRVVVPILDAARSSWVGWQGRLWAAAPKHVPKYLTAEGMDRFSTMFNEAALLVDTDTPALVVEGTFDALPYWPDVVALLGKPSEGQVSKLLRASRPLVVALDGDAWIESEMLAMRLQLDGARATWVRLPPAEDPGSLPPDWLMSRAGLRNNASGGG